MKYKWNKGLLSWTFSHSFGILFMTLELFSCFLWGGRNILWLISISEWKVPEPQVPHREFSFNVSIFCWLWHRNYFRLLNVFTIYQCSCLRAVLTTIFFWAQSKTPHLTSRTAKTPFFIQQKLLDISQESSSTAQHITATVLPPFHHSIASLSLRQTRLFHVKNIFFKFFSCTNYHTLLNSQPTHPITHSLNPTHTLFLP